MSDKQGTFVWYELLTAYFPLRLRSDVSYRYVDSASVIRSPLGASA